MQFFSPGHTTSLGVKLQPGDSGCLILDLKLQFSIIIILATFTIYLWNLLKYKKFKIVNAYIQYDYGYGKDFVDYNAMENCFNDIIRLFHGRKFGLPKIGAGLAGGNWDKIFDIIYRNFKFENATIVEYDRWLEVIMTGDNKWVNLKD